MAAMDGNETFLFAPVNGRHHRPFTDESSQGKHSPCNDENSQARHGTLTDESGKAMDSLLTCRSSHCMPWLTKALYT